MVTMNVIRMQHAPIRKGPIHVNVILDLRVMEEIVQVKYNSYVANSNWHIINSHVTKVGQKYKFWSEIENFGEKYKF